METIAEDTETIVEVGMEAAVVTETTTVEALEMREAMEMIAEVLEVEVEMSQGALGTEVTMREETITGDEDVNNEKIGWFSH